MKSLRFFVNLCLPGDGLSYKAKKRSGIHIVIGCTASFKLQNLSDYTIIISSYSVPLLNRDFTWSISSCVAFAAGT